MNPQETPTEIVLLHHDEPMTTSLAIAEGVKIPHKSVIQLVRTHVENLQKFGGVGFEIQPFETSGENSGFQIQNSANSAFEMRNSRGRPTEFAWLNEPQATLLITFMRNSKIVVDFKVALVRAFYELRGRLAAPSDPPSAIPAWDHAPGKSEINSRAWAEAMPAMWPHFNARRRALSAAPVLENPALSDALRRITALERQVRDLEIERRLTALEEKARRLEYDFGYLEDLVEKLKVEVDGDIPQWVEDTFVKKKPRKPTTH